MRCIVRVLLGLTAIASAPAEAAYSCVERERAQEVARAWLEERLAELEKLGRTDPEDEAAIGEQAAFRELQRIFEDRLAELQSDCRG
jgi:hypothetical protein